LRIAEYEIADCGLRNGIGAGGEHNRDRVQQKSYYENCWHFCGEPPNCQNPHSAIRNFMSKKELEARTKRFALSVIQLVGKLPCGKASDVIGYQLLKSGTSIGANYREANRAESHDDFIHKIAICEKEAAETEYWLELTQEANRMRKEPEARTRRICTFP
jgi:four helix bundle protein